CAPAKRVKPPTPPQPVITAPNTKAGIRTTAIAAKNGEEIKKYQPIIETLNGREGGWLGACCAKYSLVELKLNRTSHHTPIAASTPYKPAIPQRMASITMPIAARGNGGMAGPVAGGGAFSVPNSIAPPIARVARLPAMARTAL